MARPRIGKKLTKIEFLVEEEEKIEFMKLCENGGITATKIFRAFFKHKLKSLKDEQLKNS